MRLLIGVQRITQLGIVPKGRLANGALTLIYRIVGFGCDCIFGRYARVV